jgi:hypothetical protein
MPDPPLLYSTLLYSPRCSLDGNEIGDAGGVALSEVLKINATLTELQ